MLKTLLHKRVAQFGSQCDKHLAAVLWAYHNTPLKTTNEKPSFLLYGWDCSSPMEAVVLSPEDVTSTSVKDYQQELMLKLSMARKSALENIFRSQERYKAQYDRNSSSSQYIHPLSVRKNCIEGRGSDIVPNTARTECSPTMIQT